MERLQEVEEQVYVWNIPWKRKTRRNREWQRADPTGLYTVQWLTAADKRKGGRGQDFPLSEEQQIHKSKLITRWAICSFSDLLSQPQVWSLSQEQLYVAPCWNPVALCLTEIPPLLLHFLTELLILPLPLVSRSWPSHTAPVVHGCLDSSTLRLLKPQMTFDLPPLSAAPSLHWPL